jgi:hypothetical protein
MPQALQKNPALPAIDLQTPDTAAARFMPIYTGKARNLRTFLAEKRHLNLRLIGAHKPTKKPCKTQGFRHFFSDPSVG